jgi:hypothetical protein
MSLSLSEAQLLGNWFETLTYGMYFVTCGFCARTLLCIGPEDRWRRPSEIRWLILSVGIALFVVATFDVIVGLTDLDVEFLCLRSCRLVFFTTCKHLRFIQGKEEQHRNLRISRDGSMWPE